MAAPRVLRQGRPQPLPPRPDGALDRLPLRHVVRAREVRRGEGEGDRDRRVDLRRDGLAERDGRAAGDRRLPPPRAALPRPRRAPHRRAALHVPRSAGLPLRQHRPGAGRRRLRRPHRAIPPRHRGDRRPQQEPLVRQHDPVGGAGGEVDADVLPRKGGAVVHRHAQPGEHRALPRAHAREVQGGRRRRVRQDRAGVLHGRAGDVLLPGGDAEPRRAVEPPDVQDLPRAARLRPQAVPPGALHGHGRADRPDPLRLLALPHRAVRGDVLQADRRLVPRQRHALHRPPPLRGAPPPPGPLRGQPLPLPPAHGRDRGGPPLPEGREPERARRARRAQDRLARRRTTTAARGCCASRWGGRTGTARWSG